MRLRPRCRYRSDAPPAKLITSFGTPSATLRPKLRTTRRSTTAISACTTCSIQRIATPVRMDVLDGARRVRGTPPPSGPPAISSSSNNSGFGGERARHLQPLAFEQRQRAGERIGALEQAKPLENLAAGLRRLALGLAPAVDRADQEILEHGELFEGLRDLVGSGRCRRGSVLAAAGRARSRPSKRMAPASCASSPEIRLNSEVLPAPFGPMMPSASPGATADRDHRRRRSSRSSSRP